MLRVTRPNTTDAPVEIETGPAFSLLNALMREGVHVRHDCCGTCRFRALSGESGLSPMGTREADRLAAAGFSSDGQTPGGTVRLACQTHVFRNAEIELLLD
jgi:ferredoxin